jgi:hypothetical protein
LFTTRPARIDIREAGSAAPAFRFAVLIGAMLAGFAALSAGAAVIGILGSVQVPGLILVLGGPGLMIAGFVIGHGTRGGLAIVRQLPAELPTTATAVQISRITVRPWPALPGTVQDDRDRP